MSGKFLLTIDEDLLSDYTDKNKCYSDFLTNSYQGSNNTFLSINDSTNYICHNTILNTVQNKKERTPLFVNLINQSNKVKYNKSIILHILKDNKNTNSFYKTNNKDAQHTILNSSLKKNETIKKSNKENTNNNNKVFNSKNIIRVILSSEKAIKNFPMEYLHEMICDLCSNLFNFECSFDKIKTTQNNLYNQQQEYCFFDKRMSNFNFILHLTTNSCIKEATLFLAFVIFDRNSNYFICNSHQIYGE